MATQSAIEKERQRRICVSLWAYLYEYHSMSLVSDAKFDKTCSEIDLTLDTGNKKMDKWFKENFLSHTGQWIHKHPEKAKLSKLTKLYVKS